MESPAVFTSKILTLSSRFDLYCRIYCNIAKKDVHICPTIAFFEEVLTEPLPKTVHFAAQPEIRKPR